MRGWLSGPRRGGKAEGLPRSRTLCGGGDGFEAALPRIHVARTEKIRFRVYGGMLMGGLELARVLLSGGV